MLQPLSPSIIITQPESWYLFAVPRRVEGWGVMWSAQRCCSRVSAAAVSRRCWCVWNVTRGPRTNYRPATPANAVHRHRPSAKVPGARSQPTIQPMVSIVQLTIRSALRLCWGKTVGIYSLARPRHIFFSIRTTNMWNNLPISTDFSSLCNFK